MWLSDDDWLDPSYVSRCLAVLAETPATRSWPGSRATTRKGHSVDERPTDLLSLARALGCSRTWRGST